MINIFINGEGIEEMWLDTTSLPVPKETIDFLSQKINDINSKEILIIINSSGGNCL